MINFIENPDETKSLKQNNKPSHNFNLDNINWFKQALANVTCNGVYQSHNVNEGFNMFWTTFSDLFKLNFLFVSRKINKNIHKLNEHMTADLLISRSTKN
jgi:hypothetical protein